MTIHPNLIALLCLSICWPARRAEAGAASARRTHGFIDWMCRPPPAPRLLDGYSERNLPPWKIASGPIMVREAGGTITDIGGKDDALNTGHLVCGNDYVHGELLKIWGRWGSGHMHNVIIRAGG